MNGQPKSPSQGAVLLQKEILEKVKALNLPAASARKTEVLDRITQNLDASAFNNHNQEGIVEVKATFRAIQDSKKLWELEIIWDADNPVTSNKPNAQTPHYGYEIYKDGRRVAGPGHIFFAKDVILPHYRIKSAGLVERLDLKLSKRVPLGNGEMKAETHYYKLNAPI
ncbi:hypothetical protein QBC38DRAFT_547824 [Podospora fimiseda]|uniref:Uncharacterized protein n=1 Tax=Podospora fimiseda TaxID=252190 RepID=A0AAN7BJ51_9PEZI|nr:hypothetical protein QBC38DRAFT_547824 [Podospora fimiseda]